MAKKVFKLNREKLSIEPGKYYKDNEGFVYHIVYFDPKPCVSFPYLGVPVSDKDKTVWFDSRGYQNDPQDYELPNLTVEHFEPIEITCERAFVSKRYTKGNLDSIIFSITCDVEGTNLPLGQDLSGTWSSIKFTLER